MTQDEKLATAEQVMKAQQRILSEFRRLEALLEEIQQGINTRNITVSDIDAMIVSYFEAKTAAEVEGT